jgi:hypothetical protein
VDFVREVTAREFKAFPSEKFQFDSGRASVTILSESENGCGRVAGNLVGVMEVHSSVRLKNKILDEISQLPECKLNVVVYNITHFSAHFDDVEDAFYGQLALRLYFGKDRGLIHKEPVRKENGVIHTREGEQLSAIIAYEDFKYQDRKIYLNPRAKLRIEDGLVEMM